MIAIQQKNSLEENACLFATVNYALADVTIDTWELKYYYNFWRPIGAIRQATGSTQTDSNWEALGTPSEKNATNFTP